MCIRDRNCGNILAGVGQFALENGLVTASSPTTDIDVYMVNSDQVATVTVSTPDGSVSYDGDASIDGVPGQAAPVLENFPQAAGSSCGALLPTGRAVDVVNDVPLTCIDNGMPVVVMRATDLGITGYETREELEANSDLKMRIEAIRLIVGPMMNLGDVIDQSVPKMTLVAPATNGGTICTRTFIPHRCHASIGVLGAVSVATACMLSNSPAAELAVLPEGDEKMISVEHPIGETSVLMNVDAGENDEIAVNKAAILRTARKLFEGVVFTH